MVRPIQWLHLFADHRFQVADEAPLQDEIARILTEGGVAFDREVRLAAGDRIDFLVGDVGLEVKTQGGVTSVLRQLHRYAQHDRVARLVLATTKWSHARLPPLLSGKHLTILPLYRGAL